MISPRRTADISGMLYPKEYTTPWRKKVPSSHLIRALRKDGEEDLVSFYH